MFRAPQLTILFSDARLALRSLRRDAALAGVIVLTLAVGVGANAALFSLSDQLLLRPLPVEDPESLVLLSAPGPYYGWRLGDDRFSYPAYEEIRDENDAFDGVLARFGTSLTLERADAAERVTGILVSGNFFEVLGVEAAAGRVMTASDDAPDASPVAVLSHRFWRDRMGANEAAIGSTLRLNGRAVTVIGVARAGFDGVEVGRSPDLFLPLSTKPQMTPTWDHRDNRRTWFLHVFARLRDDVSLAEAEASANVGFRTVLERDVAVMPEPGERFTREYLSKPLLLKPGSQGISAVRERYRTALVVLHGMLAFVLGIVCANVANLLVARTSRRHGELALHLALGASRFSLARRVLAESMTLALVGGALGFAVALWATQLVLRLLPADAGAAALSAEPTLRTALFTALVSGAAGVFFGAIAVSRSLSPALAPTLKGEAGFTSASSARTGRVLVVTQVALATALLVGAGLFARSLANLSRVEAGFDASNLLSFRVDPSLSGYEQEEVRTLLATLSRTLDELPGVDSVSVAGLTRLAGDRRFQTIRVQGYEHDAGEDMNVGLNAVGPDYFRTMGVPLLRGRGITESDRVDTPKVAVINETMARYFFGSEDPIGRRFKFASAEEFDIEIVGVVPAGKYADLREDDVRFAYIPYPQDERISDMTFYVRTKPGAVRAESVVDAVRSVDRALATFDLGPVEKRMRESIFLDRAVAALSSGLGVLASFLAAIGLYGVMSFAVSRRTREIGLRMALGAGRGRVLSSVLTEVSKLAAVGVLIGLPAAMVLARWISSQLFEMSAWDPVAFASAVVVTLGVALASGYLPARRASNVDPIRALRWE